MQLMGAEKHLSKTDATVSWLERLLFSPFAWFYFVRRAISKIVEMICTAFLFEVQHKWDSGENSRQIRFF